MANMASVSYRIEGPRETLEKIKDAIVKTIPQKEHWNEWETCINLGFTEEELDGKRLGGEISEEPSLGENTLEFYAEERWDLQDFEELLRQKFPEIKVYWIVEESGCDVYATNDKDYKYFSERYYVDTCIDGNYQSKYFRYKSAVFKWLHDITNGKINTEEKVEEFNENCNEEDFINIHEFIITEN